MDDLLNTANQLVDQIDKGVALVGAGMEYANQGLISDGTLSESAHISLEQMMAYNSAIAAMQNYQPYGDTQTFLETQAQGELNAMNEAVDTFSEAVVQMSTVIEVADRVQKAETPNEQADVQSFVTSNEEILKVDQSTVETYNQSIDDIETHANNAGAYLGVAANKEAVEFLEQGLIDSDTTTDSATLTYDANMQWVKMTYSTGSANAVFVNGTDGLGLDLYVSAQDALDYGQQTEYYLSGPTSDSYNCYINELCQ
jgi:hypothetical protein